MANGAGPEVHFNKVFKNIIVTKPWLFIIAYSLYSNPGLTLEELKELTGLTINVLKRGVWWLKKYNIVEEKSNKYFFRTEYAKAMEDLRYGHCSLKSTHILLLDRVYIVLTIRDGRIHYWSLPAEYYEKLLYYEKLSGGSYSAEEIAYMLDVNIGTAKRVKKLRELLKLCRT